MQRVSGLPHVQARQRAPCAAHGVKRSPRSAAEQRHAAERLADDLLGLLDGFFRQILQRKTAERECHAIADSLAPHIDQFERAAAEIAHDPVRLIETRDHAECRILRFLLAREHRDVLAANTLCCRNELRPVHGITTGRGCHAPNLLDAADVAERAEPSQRFQRFLNSIRSKQSRRLDLATQASEYLFVEDGRWRARQPLVDHKAYRVGSNVDDGNRRAVMQAPLGKTEGTRLKRVRGGA